MAIDRDEQQCVDIVLANHPGDEWVYTNERYSYLDGLFVRGGVIKAVAEIKTRECKFGTYRKELMTWNKMESGQWAAKSFKCPFYLFSYHPLSDLVAAYQITDTEGNFYQKVSGRRLCRKQNKTRQNASQQENSLGRKPRPKYPQEMRIAMYLLRSTSG